MAATAGPWWLGRLRKSLALINGELRGRHKYWRLCTHCQISHNPRSMLFRQIALFSGVSAAASVTGCHFHGSDYFCNDGDGNHGLVTPAPSATADAPSSYTSCHAHGTDTFCMVGSDEVQFVVETASGSEALGSAAAHDHDHDDHDHDHDDEDDHSHSHSDSHSHGSGSGDDDEITGCHYHGSDLFCNDADGNHGSITPAPSATGDAQLSYTGCHNHGTATFCFDSASSEVQFVPDSNGHSHAHAGSNATNGTNTTNTTTTGSGTTSGATATGTGATTSSDNGAVKAGAFGAAGAALLLAGLF